MEWSVSAKDQRQLTEPLRLEETSLFVISTGEQLFVCAGHHRLEVCQDVLCTFVFDSGLLSVLYWGFFVCHWGHYFLYVRVQDQMPFFIMMWSNKWLAPLAKPPTFTGSVPLLAENFTHVVSQCKLTEQVFIPAFALDNSLVCRTFLVAEERPIPKGESCWTPDQRFSIQFALSYAGEVFPFLGSCHDLQSVVLVVYYSAADGGCIESH